MARLEDVLKKIPKKRRLLRIDRQDRELSKSKGKRVTKVFDSSGNATILKSKIKKSIPDFRKRKTRTVKKR